MKLIVSAFLIALLSFAAGLILPWWSIALAAFLVIILIPQKPAKASLIGFIAVFLLWTLLAFIIDMKNQQVLSGKIAELLPLGGSNFLLILLTGFTGGLVGGLAAMTAAYLRKAL